MQVHLAAGWCWQAHGMMRAGRIEEAAFLYARAAAVFAGHDRHAAEGEARANFAGAAMALGRHAEAREALEEALGLAERAEDRRLDLAASQALGALLLELEEPDEATGHLFRAHELAQEQGDTRRVAGVQLCLAVLHHDQGELDVAQQLASQALGTGRATLDDGLSAAASIRLACVVQEQDLDAADTAWDAADQAARRAGSPADIAAAALGRGGFELQRWRPHRARTPLRQALQSLQDLGDPSGAAACAARLAVAAVDDDRNEAERLFELAATETPNRPTRIAALTIHRLHLERDSGALEAARALVERAGNSARVRLAHRVLEAAVRS